MSYITFDQIIVKNRKTEVWLILNKNSGIPIGTIKWYAHWRQYCFFPEASTIFNRDCLAEIGKFVYNLNFKHRCKSIDNKIEKGGNDG